MGKFKLSEIRQRIESKVGGFIQDRKSSILGKALAGSEFTLEQQYKIFFWGMKGYVRGNPNSREKLVWHSLIEQVVDDESTCDDEGFVGMKIKERVKLIGKEKPISNVSQEWVEKELMPYFADSLKKQSKNISDALFAEIIKGEITDAESKKAYAVYSKNQEALRGALK